MNRKSDNTIKTGVVFFGEISASISHEIKNSLAIMNENAGLLEDLSLMVQKGIALDPERVMALSGRITKHIKIADQTVKKMNEFAHSVDTPLRRVDILEILELISALGKRHASSHGVTIELLPQDKTVSIISNPFELMNLIWMVMKYSFKHPGHDKKITVFTDKKENKLVVSFNNLKNLTCSNEENMLFEDGEFKKLLEYLNGSVIVNSEEGQIVIILQDQEEL